MKCECDCGRDASIVYVELLGNSRYLLCSKCILQFVMMALSKEQFFGLLGKGGHNTGEHMLHGDYYYEKTGVALQPISIMELCT